MTRSAAARRIVAPALFVLAAVFAILAAVDVLGFYGGAASILCIVLGVVALPRGANYR